MAAAKKRNGGKTEDARASTTDADARVMKMGDGGFRPAFNDDSQAVAEWRARMASDEAKEIYKQRAATAECVNAQARNQGCCGCPCAA